MSPYFFANPNSWVMFRNFSLSSIKAAKNSSCRYNASEDLAPRGCTVCCIRAVYVHTYSKHDLLIVRHLPRASSWQHLCTYGSGLD